MITSRMFVKHFLRSDNSRRGQSGFVLNHHTGEAWFNRILPGKSLVKRIDIGSITSHLFHNDGNAWWGNDVIGSALAYIKTDGSAYFTSLDIPNPGFATPFGDGSDGDVVISADTSLSRDMFYDNLTINTGKILSPAGYRIFVNNTLTVNGSIRRNGNAGSNGGDAVGDTSAGSGGAGGAALTSGSLIGSNPGAAGGNGMAGASGPDAGGGGTAVSNSIVGDGADGGDGQPGGRGNQYIGGGSYQWFDGSAGAAGGSGGVATMAAKEIRNIVDAQYLHDIGFARLTNGGGSGGGGGGGKGWFYNDGSEGCHPGYGGGGGGAGSAAGMIAIYARHIVFNGDIQAMGGTGGSGGKGGDAENTQAGAGGGGGGGGGGDGGAIILVYHSWVGSQSGISAVYGPGGDAGVKGDFGEGPYPFIGAENGENGAVGVKYFIQIT